jgi:uncharacterized membrane protein YdjX (TVP38/TMEM64 family)
MEKAKKIKIFIGLFYLVLFVYFYIFSFQNLVFKILPLMILLKKIDLIFLNLKNSNLFLISIIFLLLTILWVFPFLGFGSPVALIWRIYFWKMDRNLIVVLGLSIGATFLYMFGNYFLKDLIREKFLNKFKKS